MAKKKFEYENPTYLVTKADLYGIYNQGFNIGANNGPFPDSGIFMPFENMIPLFDDKIVTTQTLLICDACGKVKEEDLDHCPCLDGKEWNTKTVINFKST